MLGVNTGEEAQVRRPRHIDTNADIKRGFETGPDRGLGLPCVLSAPSIISVCRNRKPPRSTNEYARPAKRPMSRATYPTSA